MTSLMFSISLGFIIFLSIVSRIPFANEMQEHLKEMGRSSILITQGNLPLEVVEATIKKHQYAFESWGAIT
jgi:6-phosphogluconolactonase/glucosamine-6-phosphate isomerase/deaminase